MFRDNIQGNVANAGNNNSGIIGENISGISNAVDISQDEFNAVTGNHLSVTINVGPGNDPRLGPNQSLANDEPTRGFEGDIARQEFTVRRPPTPPTQNGYDIYYRHMATKRRGSPLWIPEPNKSLSIQYQRQGIAIGDVGIITAFGSFDFLFNICLAHDDPMQPKELPENFTPFHYEQSDVQRQSEFKHDSYLASASIERSQHDGDQSGQIFKSSASEGAILTMPVGSKSEDLGNVIRLRRYVALKAVSWYKYVYDVRGREVLNGDVRLVTGWDKTKAWGMASFANSAAQKDSFRLKFGPIQQGNIGRTYVWDYSGMAQVRAGPDKEEIDALRLDDPSQEGLEYQNQCLFIRTMNLTLPDKVWKELASELDIQVGLDAENLHLFTAGSMQGFSISGNSSGSTNPSAFIPSNYGGAHNTSRTAGKNIEVQSIHLSTMAAHPSKAINQMLLESSDTEVQMVITEDKDWISALDQEDYVLPSGEDLCARIKASFVIREKEGIVFLEPKQNQLNISDSPISPIPESSLVLGLAPTSPSGAEIPRSVTLDAVPGSLPTTPKQWSMKSLLTPSPQTSPQALDQRASQPVLNALERFTSPLPIHGPFKLPESSSKTSTRDSTNEDEGRGWSMPKLKRIQPSVSHNHSQDDAIPFILVMGQTGVGKSNFINRAVGKNVADVSDSLESVTRQPEAFYCSPLGVYLVDTSGFDSTYDTDNDILRGTLDWLRVDGPRKMPHAKFGGILYLAEAGQQHFPMFSEFKQSTIKDQIVVVGMKAGKMRKEVDIRFNDSTASALEAIGVVLEKNGHATFDDCLKAMETMLWGSNVKNRKARSPGMGVLARLIGNSAAGS